MYSVEYKTQYIIMAKKTNYDIPLMFGRTEIVGDTLYIFLGEGDSLEELTADKILSGIEKTRYPKRMPRMKVALINVGEIYDRKQVCEWATTFNKQVMKDSFKQIVAVHHDIYPYKMALCEIMN